MGAAQKKVVIRRFKGGLAWGYLPATGFLDEGHVRVLEADGRTKAIELRDIKTICFVRDFNLDDTEDPERIGRRNFAGRPRGEGLWLRLQFRDGEALEGLSVFDMAFVNSLVEERGLFLNPPDVRGNALRIFVPRSAVDSLEVLGYVTTPSKRLAAKKDASQPSLFEE